MTRIVAGALGGRRLAVPPGTRTRPTSDRVREALFNTLESLTELAGARVADLYAGSGAVGLEALSRGAEHVLLVEADARVSRTLRENVAALTVAPAGPTGPGLRGSQAHSSAPAVRLVTAKVATVLAAGPVGGPYDVVFADPPYAMPEDEVTAMLTELVARDWLAPAAVVAVERSTRAGELRWVPGLTEERSRRYGETTVWYGRRS